MGMGLRGHSLFAVIVAATFAFGQAETTVPDRPANPSHTSERHEASTKPPTAASAELTKGQIKDMIQKVAEKDLENNRKLHDYTYCERQEQHKLNGEGAVASTETKTFDVLQIYGESVYRLVAKDDKPLSDKEAAKEDEKIQKLIDKRRNESDSERAKRLKKEEKEREDGREFVKEIGDAYNFTHVGTEQIEGRETYVIAAEPRPGFEPGRKEAKLLQKIRGRIWIDAAENQWVRLDAEVIDTISFGLFLARLHKGTHIVTEQTRVNDEVWLPRHTAVHVDVRVALLKNFNVNIDVTDKDYKKFHAESKIVGGVEEVKEQR
jgi:hypothetical protein